MGSCSGVYMTLSLFWGQEFPGESASGSGIRAEYELRNDSA